MSWQLPAIGSSGISSSHQSSGGQLRDGDVVWMSIATIWPKCDDNIGFHAAQMAHDLRDRLRWLGLIQLAPRAVVEGIAHRLIPGADEGWAAAGVDEFLRAYLTPAGRAAFYAAARHIYLEAPGGDEGFWPRLSRLEPDALFVWGRRDTLVPIAFERHVAEALPSARHLELDCGHVPQIELPRQTHEAVGAFFTQSAGSPHALAPTG